MPEIVPVNSTFHEVRHAPHYYKWLESKSERYKEYRRKWADNPKSFIDEGYPLNLDIEASSMCNLKCPMCPRTLAVAKEGPGKASRYFVHFDFDLFKRLIDEAAELGVPALKLNWLGEPLMNPRIADMVRYAKEKGIEDVIMNTNAVLLTEEMSRALISAGIDRLFFSFEAPDKETYEKIRVGAKFENVLGNIARFNEIRKEMGALSPSTRVSMVMLPELENTMEAYKKLFEGIVDVVAYDEFMDYENDYLALLNERKGLRFACADLWHRIIIGADGEIAVCCVDHSASCNIGNIKDMTIKEAWNSPRLKEIRDLHQNMRWFDVDICKGCPSVHFDTSGSV